MAMINSSMLPKVIFSRLPILSPTLPMSSSTNFAASWAKGIKPNPQRRKYGRCIDIFSGAGNTTAKALKIRK